LILSKIKSKTLRDLLKVLSGNIVAQGLGFLTIILISRDLGAEQYGVFSLLLAIFTISIQVSDFGISTSYVKYVSENLSKAKEIFFTIVVSKIVLSFIVALSLYFLSEYISVFFFESNIYAKLIELISVAILFHSIYGVMVANYQAKQHFKQFAFMNIFHNLLKILAVVFISFSFIQNEHLEYFIYAYSFSVVFILLFLLLTNIKNISFKNHFDITHFIEIYKLGFWIFLSALIVIFMMRLDLFMLQKLDTSESVGLFAVVLTTNSIFILILSSLTSTLLPKVNNYLENNTIDSYIKKLFSFKWYILIFTVVMIVLSPLFINIFFGDTYEKSILAFQILALSYFFSFYAAPLSLVIINKNKAHLLSIMNFFQLIIMFILNLILIPKYGLNGAAISLSAMRVFGYLYVYIYIKRNYL
jgi:O-antigen/teichoic acid export membrane protein